MGLDVSVGLQGHSHLEEKKRKPAKAAVKVKKGSAALADVQSAIRKALVEAIGRGPIDARKLQAVSRIASESKRLLAALDPTQVELPKRGRRGMFFSSNPISVDADDSDSVAASPLNNETFGAKVLRELMAVIKPAVSTTSATGAPPASLQLPVHSPWSLVEAIAKAKEHGLEHLIPELEAELKRTLHGDAPAPAITGPSDVAAAAVAPVGVVATDGKPKPKKRKP